MPNCYQHFSNQLRALCDKGSHLQSISLHALVGAIPRLDQLNLSSKNRAVIIRCDLDVPLKGGHVADDTRLKSCIESTVFCIDHGLAVVLLGHLGRDPKASLAPVIEPLSNLLGQGIDFVQDWVDEDRWVLTETAGKRIRSAAPGSIILLENLRRYSFERALWKVDNEQLDTLGPKLSSLSYQIRDQISDIEINEAIAASNRDFSSSVLPLAMRQSGIGFFIYEELVRYARRVVLADLLIFSGVKTNKLDDLEGIVNQGHVRDLIVGGALAMALVKARDDNVCIGLAETDPHYMAYVAPERIEQARRILGACRAQGTRVHLPVDYILQDGDPSSSIPQDSAQLDIGPQTALQFSQVIRSAGVATSGAKRILFLNGVMGMVEDPRFREGTRTVLSAVADITSDITETYVGGGDGRSALFDLGYGDRVSHAFTAGGTILKLMSGKAIPYLVAMYLQNTSEGRIS